MKKLLWPKLELGNLRTPKSILEEQAEGVGEMTNNILTGCVATRIDTMDDFDAALYSRPKELLVHIFYILAPSLKNYRYELLTIEQEIASYPVTINFRDERMVCKDEEEFIKELGRILNLESTINVIKSLYAQVK